MSSYFRSHQQGHDVHTDQYPKSEATFQQENPYIEQSGAGQQHGHDHHGNWQPREPSHPPNQSPYPYSQWGNGVNGEGQSSKNEWSAGNTKVAVDDSRSKGFSLKGSVASCKPKLLKSKLAAPLKFWKVMLVLFAAALFASLGYLLYEILLVPDYSCELIDARLVVASRRISIKNANFGDVCVLKSTSNFVIGRSYDNNPWEDGAVSPVKFTCSADSCEVTLPPDGTFFLEKFKNPSGSLTLSRNTEVSRFLIQASFGPTQREIDDFGDKTFKAWIEEQIALPATLHRAYFRKRSNPRSINPTDPGRPRRACEHLSRWHRFAFTENDIGSFMVVSAPNAGFRTITINGIARTRIPNADWPNPRGGPNFKICSLDERVLGDVKFGTGCRETLKNPAINLVTLDREVSLSAGDRLEPMKAVIDDVVILKAANRVSVPSCNVPALGPAFIRDDGGTIYQHDSRLVLLDNTIDSPAVDYDLDSCPSAPKTFVNEAGCVVGGGKGCAPTLYANRNLPLSEVNIRKFQAAGHFVYRIQNLPIASDPCRSAASRWQRSGTSCIETAGVAAGTAQIFRNHILAAEGNPIRDITLTPAQLRSCNPANTRGAILRAGGFCYKHVHPDELNVYDFSKWALIGNQGHPGNEAARDGQRANPIMRNALENLIALNFPRNAPHRLSNWESAARSTGPTDPIRYVGVFGRSVNYKNLPPSLQDEETATAFGATKVRNPDDDLFERCGSPGEVANDPSLGNRFHFAQSNQHEIQFPTDNQLDHSMTIQNCITSIWQMIGLYSPDQLRQRVAFALAQIPVVTINQVPGFEDEIYLAYYDIFVRHAFGNYKDVLMEVSFSPMMNQMLTYEETKSIDYSFSRTGQEIFPDENYAREIMQLFSVGLLQLNNDGTVKKSASGLALETYTNDDIFEFSRIWTGFRRAPGRGNFENQFVFSTRNRLDPIFIEPSWHDLLPKMNLYKGHIGDGLPLCTDFPDRAFLLKGAKWRYIGVSSRPHLQTNEDLAGFGLLEDSLLYRALCNKVGGKCQYRSQVVLDSDLLCTGTECNVQTLRVVKVGRAHYEYVQKACISMSFFDDAVKIYLSNKSGGMCANKKALAASPICCTRNGAVGGASCTYGGERVSYPKAQEKCSGTGRRVCDANSFSSVCSPKGYYWTDTQCRVNMKVRMDGQVSIVHDITGERTTRFSVSRMLTAVNDNSKTFFRVNWIGGRSNIPTVANGCLDGLCEVFQEEYCMCSKTVLETAAFSEMPTREQIQNELHIGSLSPEAYDGAYNLVESTESVNLYSTDPRDIFAMDSIFEVTLKGVKRYFRNKRSMVMLSDGVGFRNPASVMSLSEPTFRDAQYETEEFVDHLLFHPNTPPFIAYRMIQRFVSSNPSPRYVDVVATAFSSGVYEGIGSNKWGDLAATMAAVLLDKEARNMALDYDPYFGQLREPVLKWMHAMRSLGAKPTVPGRQFEPTRLEFYFAEEPHRQPNVFNYFRPEFSPPGPVADARLVAPEAQIMTTPKVVNFINGIVALARFGVGNCYGGFNRSIKQHAQCNGLNRNRDTLMNFAEGKLTWRPKGGLGTTTRRKVVEELSLLLTAGRLSLDIFDDAYLAYDIAFEAKLGGRIPRIHYAVMAVQQLVLASPEFQVTNHVQRYDELRPEAAKRNGTKPYKAIINLFLGGGLDSYNMLVPLADCRARKDMYAEYKQVRGDVAIPKADLLPIDVPTDVQVCEKFGLHPELPFIQRLYAEGDALFLANIGVLVEPITKKELLDGSKEVPESLFAHNIQQQSTQTLKPQDRSTVGVLGRMNDVM